ncbi:unnamed protein product [Trichobilharzia regenti]|nr:unnamed protein product [Trichobilharzia regenti]
MWAIRVNTLDAVACWPRKFGCGSYYLYWSYFGGYKSSDGPQQFVLSDFQDRRILAEEAICNLTTTLKAYLTPPSISASSTAATLIDPKLMKLLTESLGYLDMVRFSSSMNTHTASMTMAATPTSPMNYSTGFNDGNGSLNRSISGRAGSSIGSRVYCSARLVAFNIHHTIVKSYPSFFIIPQGITQNCLTKVARSHKRGRFPVVTWQHPETGAYLLRGSEMQSNIILNTFKNIKTASKGSTGDNVDDGVDTTGSHATVSKEHIRYIRALVDMSLSAMNNSRPSSVITSETGYSATDDLSNSSQLPNAAAAAAGGTTSSMDHLPREHNTISHPATATVVSSVTNNKTRCKLFFQLCFFLLHLHILLINYSSTRNIYIYIYIYLNARLSYRIFINIIFDCIFT